MQRQLPRNRLAEVREARDLKRYDIASHLRVDPSTIYRWEIHETPVPDWAKESLAEFYDLSIAYLMGWESEAAA